VFIREIRGPCLIQEFEEKQNFCRTATCICLRPHRTDRLSSFTATVSLNHASTPAAGILIACPKLSFRPLHVQSLTE
jgi:hypothetical protein